MTSKKERLTVLKNRWAGCTKCDLAKKRADEGSKMVFGGGVPANVDFLFIYDYPTVDDATTGRPFSGDVGRIVVDHIIKRAGIDTSRVYATPLVSCRPYTVVPATEKEPASIKACPPTSDEISACLDRVKEIIYITDPQIILTMGPESWGALVRGKDRGRSTSLAKAVATGEIMNTYVLGIMGDDVHYASMPLLSIDQLIANPSAAAHGPIAVTLEAIHAARHYVTNLKKLNGET